MEPRTAALLSLSFLLLLTHGLTNEGPTLLPIKLTVENKLNAIPTQDYNAFVKENGALLGAMTRLQKQDIGFTFTVIPNVDYGPFLESVNGVAGNQQDHTYWELLSESSGNYTSLPLGVGCYLPKANEHIIFNFTTW